MLQEVCHPLLPVSILLGLISSHKLLYHIILRPVVVTLPSKIRKD